MDENWSNQFSRFSIIENNITLYILVAFFKITKHVHLTKMFKQTSDSNSCEKCTDLLELKILDSGKLYYFQRASFW